MTPPATCYDLPTTSYRSDHRADIRASLYQWVVDSSDQVLVGWPCPLPFATPVYLRVMA